MNVKCNCKDWEKNVTIIDTALILAKVHGEIKDVKRANYCMYCGKKLIEYNSIGDKNE